MALERKPRYCSTRLTGRIEVTIVGNHQHIGEQRAFHYIQALQHAVTMIDADTNRTIQSATLKHQYKLGYADSFAAALALESRATLVSADASFEKTGKSLKWMRLPKFETKRR